MDCGDFGSTVSKAQIQKVSYLLRGMSLLKYDAINLGEKDLQYGKEFLDKMRDQYDLPFISANIYHRGTDELYAKPFIIKEVGDTKIGLLGVMTTQITPQMKNSHNGFEIKDPILAIENTVDKLRKECDVIIVLSHLGLPKSQSLAKQVEGIDFIVSGHGWNLSRQPSQVAKTVIMQPGSKGKYLGHLDFEVSLGNVSLIQGKCVALSDKIPDDDLLSDLVKQYDKATSLEKSGTN